MTGLFLRYCWRCNSTQTIAKRGDCGECGETLKVVDAHALIPALGGGMLPDERRVIVEDLTGHDVPT